MKRASITDDLGWPQRIPREAINSAEYGDPIRFDSTHAGHSFVAAVSLVGACAVIALLLAGVL